MRIVLAECDHDSFEPEIELAREAGVELEVALSHDVDELVEHTRGADGLLMQYAPITGEVLDRLPGLRSIGRYGVGYDTIDVPAATARGVAVSNVTDYGSESVSDHAVALALTLLRGIPVLDRGIRRGSHDLAPVKPLHEFGQQTFGVVGLGAIGRATARKAVGLGFRVLGFDTVIAQGSAGLQGVEPVTLDRLLEESDVVSLHVPLTSETHHLIDAGALRRMPDHAVLVNTSRGGVVDTDALVATLGDHRLAGAGLDVLEQEPIALGHPLLEFDRVVLTPHSAWYSEESYVRLKRRTLQNVIDVLSDRTPHDLLNPEALSAARTVAGAAGAGE